MPTCKIRKFSLATATSLLTSALLYSPMISAGQTEYRIIPYLWTAGIDVEFGKPGMTTDADVDFDDYIDFSDIGAAFIFDAVGEKWSFTANILYVELSEDIDLPATTVDVEIRESIFEFAVGYRPQDFDNVRILGGARYLDLETTIDPAWCNFRRAPQFMVIPVISVSMVLLSNLPLCRALHRKKSPRVKLAY